MKYRVTYYYLATGMEGIPDIEDFGIVESENSDDARQQVALREYPEDKLYGPNNSHSTRSFFLGCLTAKETQ